METIHTVIEQNYINDISKDYFSLIENILEIGESVKDIDKHYDEIFEEGSLIITKGINKDYYRGSLKQQYESINDRLLLTILCRSFYFGKADVYRNDEVFAVEVEVD